MFDYKFLSEWLEKGRSKKIIIFYKKSNFCHLSTKKNHFISKTAGSAKNRQFSQRKFFSYKN